MSTSFPTRRGTRAMFALLLTILLTAGLAPQYAIARTGDRAKLLQLTNEDREQEGRNDLDLARSLSRVAARHSRDMAAAGYIFHTDDLDNVFSPYSWSIGGENVGMGSDLESLQDAFMDSPPHRRNILRRPFEHVGIGVVKRDGYYWVTVLFYG